MKIKIFRAVVSILLVCILIFNITPMRAQASVLGGAALLFGDDAVAIILAVLAGLGVFAVANSETSDLESRAIAQSALDAMQDAGSFVHDGALSVYTSLTESWSYAVPTGLVQWLHNWMFDTGVVTSVGAHYSANTPCLNIHGNEITPLCDYNVYQVRWTDTATDKQYAKKLFLFIGGNTYLNSSGTLREATSRKFGNKTYYISSGDTSYKAEFAGYHDLGYIDSSGFTNSAEAALAYLFEHYITVNTPSVTTPYDLALGTVAPPGTDIETEYGEHIVIIAPNGVPDTGGDGGDDEQHNIPVLPIPYLPPNEIPNVPQEDIWEGNKVEIETPDSGEIPDPTTGSDTEPGTGSDATVSSTPWEQFKKWISEGWNNITKAIPTAESIGQSIGNVIKELFIPSPDTIGQKIGEMRDLFPFIDGIISTGEAIRDGLSYDIAPPEIWIDLGEATTDTFGHKKYLITDFSWYAPYKPRVDALLSAALWAFFSWRVFIRLPSIIGGEGGQIESFAVHSFEARMEKEQADDKKRRNRK